MSSQGQQLKQKNYHRTQPRNDSFIPSGTPRLLELAVLRFADAVFPASRRQGPCLLKGQGPLYSGLEPTLSLSEVCLSLGSDLVVWKGVSLSTAGGKVISDVFLARPRICTILLRVKKGVIILRQLSPKCNSLMVFKSINLIFPSVNVLYSFL